MRNSSTGLSKDTMREITRDYMDRLTVMGYSMEWHKMLGRVKRGESTRTRKGPEDEEPTEVWQYPRSNRPSSRRSLKRE